MKFIRTYLFTGILLLIMIIVGIRYSVSEQKYKEHNKNSVSTIEKTIPPPMDTNLWITIIGTVTILAGLFFNPKIRKIEITQIKFQEDNLKQFKDLSDENQIQHDDLHCAIKKLQVKVDLETSLREIIDGILSVTSGELSGFIDFEGSQFVDFVKEVMSGSFNLQSLPAIRTKLYNNKKASALRAKELGEDFAEIHLISQSECSEKFYTGVEDALLDDVFNSKNKRFKMLCEQYLHTHLTDSVRGYMKVKSQS